MTVNWQSIESAPKDAGRWLVVGMLDTERFPAPTWHARFVGGMWEDDERRCCSPTHWLSPTPSRSPDNG